MAEQLTAQQKQAVEDRGGKLLVSAAAGSGKTKVLVDRLLSYLTDPVQPANLDDFLIITYTKAAAAELRSKIASKLSQRIADNPENRHLQQQMQRLYLTKISTVHSFCADILREYAFRLDLPADFRVADENECLELQMRVMQQVLDAAYENADNDPDFCAFVDSQGFGRDDRSIPEILLRTYNSAKCHLDPDGWLSWCITAGNVSGVEDVSQTVWGAYLIEDLHSYLQLHIQALDKCCQLASEAPGFEKPAALLYDTIRQLQSLQSCDTWDDICMFMDIDYGRMVFPKNCSAPELAEQIKAVRDTCKKGVAKKLRRFNDDSFQVLADLASSMSAARGLVNLTKEFSREYDRLKRSRRILDFGDLEHRMLDLLLGKSRSGVTQTAREIGQRFREVMVDEYQDSNAVQDAIFSALTAQRNNCFMVGDVKQSIYQFRLADPGIFLEKYNTYVSADDALPGQGRKVLLSCNFRSAGSVIDAVNDVFSTCMSPQVGGLVYGDEEMLKEGVLHQPMDEPEIELYGVDVQEDTYAEEAAFTADRVLELLDGTHMVREKDTLRPITPDDIVILLRSPGSVGGEFQYALESRGIHCWSGSGNDLLHTEEIEVLRSLLQVISNPLQDIPLIAALTSRVFGFTADDLASIRAGRRGSEMFQALSDSPLEKATAFVQVLNVLRREERSNSLSHLLSRIFALTHLDSIYASLPDGTVRVENLQTFCKLAGDFEATGARNLDQFLEHLNALEERGVSATAEQKSSGAVTIMSIHKSKGLEFPVVFLCGLSRDFNRESARAQVLCDKELGLGLSCVDTVNRVRYPSVAKRAIAAKINADSLSEEMRVLYVAMTRAKDRLIMTYAAKNVEQDLEDIRLRMKMSDPLLLTGDANCPGLWVLLTALTKQINGWRVQIVQARQQAVVGQEDAMPLVSLPQSTVMRLKETLAFCYPYLSATAVPSKQTATQLKGRDKDREAAQDAPSAREMHTTWRKPSFIQSQKQGKTYGNAIHAVMQHIRYEACADTSAIQREIQRLITDGYISDEQAELVCVDQIAEFFDTDLGKKLRSAQQVLREFKFSILEDASRYYPNVDGEKILLQGVVDCALIEDDGITVIDFKSDRVSEETVDDVTRHYQAQLTAYAQALSRIYELPVKTAQLYFFRLNRFVKVI